MFCGLHKKMREKNKTQVDVNNVNFPGHFKLQGYKWDKLI